MELPDRPPEPEVDQAAEEEDKDDTYYIKPKTVPRTTMSSRVNPHHQSGNKRAHVHQPNRDNKKQGIPVEAVQGPVSLIPAEGVSCLVVRRPSSYNRKGPVRNRLLMLKDAKGSATNSWKTSFPEESQDGMDLSCQ